MMDPKDKDAVLQLKDRMLNYMYDSSLVSLAIFESTSLTFPGGLRHCMTACLPDKKTSNNISTASDKDVIDRLTRKDVSSL